MQKGENIDVQSKGEIEVGIRGEKCKKKTQEKYRYKIKETRRKEIEEKNVEMRRNRGAEYPCTSDIF